MTLSDSVRTVALVVACLPLVLLTGCPQDQEASPGNAPASTTAPTIMQSAAAPTQSAQAAPSTAQSVDNSARAFKVQQLINSAEAAYRSGVDNYRAGRLDSARLDFDSAVDLMLTSGMDLKTDPQLADEFDHLLNAVNSLEMAALKQGNGFSPKIEEAPLDTAEDLTFPANPELTAKLKAELQTASDLPLVINDQVAGYIGYFANSPSFHAHMLASMERAGKYKTMIQKALTAQGVPQDLIYLAVAESGFQPQALNSRSGAGGMWQFMPTGAYGLARNGFFDERFDPEKSSIAYAKYMKSLYNQFGDWYLAMAAYDWGPGNVQRAVQRTGYADFWELYRRNALPRETRDYVPKILAAVIMAKNPEKYGLDKMVPNEPVVSDTVSIDYAIDLRLVADVTNSSLPEIVALNPSLLRMTTPGDMPFDLHIPIGTRDVFTERLKEIPEDKRSTWRFHVVRSGESLDGIVASLHAHLSDVNAANGLSATDSVDAGDELVIPVTVAQSTRPQRYTVRRGDTLVTVSDRFGVSVEELRRWNHLRSSTVRPGYSLAVAEPVKLAPGTHLRGRGARRRRGARTLSTSVHQGSAHPASGRTGSKTSGASTKNKTAGKKTAGAARPSSTTKTKKKATR
ncbi:transglycosylase SLT domain-containing protein [Tunturibacter empetritectus]|uniref:Membrane-bound lytic murein transglycosylase D n=1 Tax=Tunturiibacter empetritectus TaxID=3069691 RepID=A0A7W8IKC4_9BACT|nr:lytic transglycosylase domain-containing protein [Edaphobacter lichenicola]MBB5318766.1 membrane-bound lytic murein transglycosylase D [Edaphobacter lichenicola]